MKLLARRLRPWLRQTVKAAVGLIYPPGCACCRAEIMPPDDALLLCDLCRKRLTPKSRQTCGRCGASLAGGPTAAIACPHCRGLKFRFEKVVALGSYHAELRDAVLRVKRPGADPLAAALGQLLVDTQRDRLVALGTDVVMPVPMHWRRQLARGTNGPELIAAAIANRLGNLRLRRGLVRCRNTSRQTDVPADQRAANVRSAFRIVGGWNPAGSRVLLIDDILTTGATADEAAGALMTGGAAEVSVAVIARADSPDVHF